MGRGVLGALSHLKLQIVQKMAEKLHDGHGPDLVAEAHYALDELRPLNDACATATPNEDCRYCCPICRVDCMAALRMTNFQLKPGTNDGI